MNEFKSKKKERSAKLFELKELIFNSLVDLYGKRNKSFEVYSQRLIIFLESEKTLIQEINISPELLEILKKSNRSRKKDIILEIFAILDEYELTTFKIDYNRVKKLLNFINLNKTYPKQSELSNLDITLNNLGYYKLLLRDFSVNGEFLFKIDYINNRIKILIFSHDKNLKDKISLTYEKEIESMDLDKIVKKLKEKHKNNLSELNLANLVINGNFSFKDSIKLLKYMEIEPFESDVAEILDIREKVQLISIEEIISLTKNMFCENCSFIIPHTLLNLLKSQEEIICPNCGIRIRKMV